MARGRLLRTKVREAKALARAKLEGERQFYNTQKGRIWWLQTQIGDFLKKDPVKLTVFIGTTYLVYKTLEKADDVVKKLTEVSIGPRFDVGPRFRVGPQPPFGGGPIPITEGVSILESMGLSNITLILLSMLLAYLIMEHGVELIGSIVGGARMVLGLV